MAEQEHIGRGGYKPVKKEQERELTIPKNILLAYKSVYQTEQEKKKI